MSRLVVRTSEPAGGVEPPAITWAAAQTWLLNRPDTLNALDPDLVDAMHEALAAAEADSIRVVVLRGAGRSFCAGADLNHLRGFDPGRGTTPRDLLASIWDLTLAMERSPVVFVAALHGHVVAGGLELALACDVVLAAEGTKIGDGHVRHNLLPGGGASARLERAVGRGAAAWLALSGELVDAADPALGQWLHAVAPQDALDDAARDVQRALLEAHPVAQQRYKRLLSENGPAPSERDRDHELDLFDQHWLDQDVPETLRLFMTRRKKAS